MSTNRLLVAIVILLLWIALRPQPGRYQFSTEGKAHVYDTATGETEYVTFNNPVRWAHWTMWAHWYWPYRDAPWTSGEEMKKRDIRECTEARDQARRTGVVQTVRFGNDELATVSGWDSCEW